ncbi:hypothetical protein LTR84_000265 [Exophiala bonariae]|uniref:Uncharacterized protein n=1 Tax=Exophiala bonariae TaxID=1690606 RepID=A0AAV9NTL0_9EURO|nr:hypothetical protein LTR84_000265 [Exophiala bonariae]
MTIFTPKQGAASNHNVASNHTQKRRATSSSPPQSMESKKTTTLDVTSLNADQKRPICATTFGIEFELILAFHEDMLKTTLSDYNIEAKIRKTFEYEKHAELLGQYGNLFLSNHSHNFDRQYPSWALQVPKTDAILETNHYHLKYPTSLQKSDVLRRYVMEPLLIAKRGLDINALPCNAVGWAQSNGQTSVEVYPNQLENILIRNTSLDYTKWTLTNDDTLIGALKSQITSYLSKKNINKDSWSSWDSHGIELISPIFTLTKKDEALEQIGKYLKALDSTQLTILPSVWASTHVHIGFDYSSASHISTPLFQHLAYILLLHEDLISKCFPKSRSGIIAKEPKTPTEPITPFDSEDATANDEQRVLSMEAKYTGIDNVESNLEHFCDQTGVDLNSTEQQDNTMEDHIFQEQCSIFSLIRLLQKCDPHKSQEFGEWDAPRFRGYIYNFANLWAFAEGGTNDKPAKPTVEFRQHDCTTEPGVIKHWIIFLEALIRVAEEKSLETTKFYSKTQLDMTKPYSAQQRDKYPTREGSSYSWAYDNMYQFCARFLGLDKEEATYWQGRFDLHKDDRPMRNSE